LIYIKDFAFRGFPPRVQIHFWNANVSWTLQSTSSGQEAAWYWPVPPGHSFFIYYLLEWWRERRELWIGRGERGGGNRSVFNNQENSFPYFYLCCSHYLYFFIVRVFLYLYGFSIRKAYFLESMMLCIML